MLTLGEKSALWRLLSRRVGSVCRAMWGRVETETQNASVSVETFHTMLREKSTNFARGRGQGWIHGGAQGAPAPPLPPPPHFGNE